VDQLGEIACGHQVATGSRFDCAIGISQRFAACRNEGFAGNRGHGGDQPAVGDVIGTHLAVDHRRPGSFQIHLRPHI
jgi:hypothetical protein